MSDSLNPLDDLKDFAKDSLRRHEDMRAAIRRETAGIKPVEVRRSYVELPAPKGFADPPAKFPKQQDISDIQVGGRFTVYLSNEKLYISDGCAARINPEDLAESFSAQVVPGFPFFEGAPLNSDPRKYVNVAGFSTTKKYEVRWIDSGGSGDLAVEENTETREEDFLVIATFTLKLSAGKKVFDDFSQLWNSDILWSEAGSSSSSSEASSSESSSSESSSESSEESSEGSSGDSGSSKDSAVVRGPDGRYLKWYCMEATEVLFFDFQEFKVGHGTSRVEIDPVVLFCTERGTLRAFGSPDVGNVNVTVDGDNVVVRPRFSKARKTQTVQVMLKGIRRGFAGIRNEFTTFDVFVDNECRLNPRMTRKQIIAELAKRGVTK